VHGLLNDSARWGGRAEEARHLAAQLEDPQAKSALLEIAYQYERLAKLAVRRREQIASDPKAAIENASVVFRRGRRVAVDRT
jgi:hypothetical protein